MTNDAEALKPCPCCIGHEQDLTEPHDVNMGIEYVVCQLCGLRVDREGWNLIPRHTQAITDLLATAKGQVVEINLLNEEVKQLKEELGSCKDECNYLDNQLNGKDVGVFHGVLISSVLDFVAKDESRPLSRTGLIIALAEYIFSDGNCYVEYGNLDTGHMVWCFENIDGGAKFKGFDFSLLPVIGDKFQEWEYGGEEWNEEHIKDWPEEYKNLARAKASGNTILFGSLSEQLEKSGANHE